MAHARAAYHRALCVQDGAVIVTLSSSGSGLVGCLEGCWEAIREEHPDVPEAVVLVGSGSGERSGYLKLGHFAAHRWEVRGENRHEVLIGGEGLQRGPIGVLGTLLHEAAHGLAQVRQVQDTSRGGRYHNRRYKTLAEELGLEVCLDGPGGWTATEVPLTTQVAYAGELERLQGALVLWRREEARRGGRGAGSGSRNYLPRACSCHRRIRVATATLIAAPIVCGACGGEFEPTGGGLDA